MSLGGRLLYFQTQGTELCVRRKSTHPLRQMHLVSFFFCFILMPQLWPHLASKTHFLSSVSSHNEKLAVLSCCRRCCCKCYLFLFCFVFCRSSYVEIVAWSTTPKSAQSRKPAVISPPRCSITGCHLSTDVLVVLPRYQSAQRYSIG